MGSYAVLNYLDTRISEMIRVYLGLYAEIVRGRDGKPRRALLGMDFLAEIERKSFEWPKRLDTNGLAA